MKALKAIEKNCGVAVYNLGIGRGYSVLEVVYTFEKVSGVTIPYVIAICALPIPAAFWKSAPLTSNRFR